MEGGGGMLRGSLGRFRGRKKAGGRNGGKGWRGREGKKGGGIYSQGVGKSLVDVLSWKFSFCYLIDILIILLCTSTTILRNLPNKHSHKYHKEQTRTKTDTVY